MLCDSGIRDEGRVAVEAPAGGGEFELRPGFLGGHRERDPGRACRHIPQQLVAKIAGLQGDQCTDAQHGPAQIGGARRGPAEFLADHRDLGERGTGTTELFRCVQADPAGLHQQRPIGVLDEEILCD